MRALEQDFGLHVRVEQLSWPTSPNARLIDGRLEGEPAAILDRLGTELGFLWTVVSPQTVILVPDARYGRLLAPQRGVAIVPLSPDAAAVRRLASAPGIEATAEFGGDEPRLVVLGRWEDLGALIEAAAEPASAP